LFFHSIGDARMTGPVRHEVSSATAAGTHPDGAPWPADEAAEPVRRLALAAAGDFGACTAVFHFQGKVDGVPYPTLSAGQQDAFLVAFGAEIGRLRAWCAAECWIPDLVPEMQVHISDEYRISRALIPAAVGRRGRMEFPAWKIVAGEAAILHELVHVFFPNGNRMLAEGLAIHLQANIGGNPAFPNFGRPLHEVAAQVLDRMTNERSGAADGKLEGTSSAGVTLNDIAASEAVRLGQLDRIATPSGLRLRVGMRVYGIEDSAHTYPLVGSFVAFLIETRGLERFSALYERTPLVPFARDAGAQERWREVYGEPLSQIESEWKSTLATCHHTSDPLLG
jgi:hypothetical protein